MEPVAVIGGFIVLAVVIRLIAGAFDGDRVKRYLKDNGFTLIDKSWAPFGPGWFGEQESRIYDIIYRDLEGRVHRAHVKTSMLTGVYLSNDRLIEDKPARSIDEEKAELRRRLSELESRDEP